VSAPRRRPVRVAGEHGFSLVEMMVALTIGLILLGGAMSMLISNKWTYRIAESVSRIQENGRLAVEFLTWDLRMAGYLGCLTDTTKVSNHVNGASGGLLDATVRIEGVNDVAATGNVWYPSGATAMPAGMVEGSDAFVVRYLDPDSALPVEAPFMPQPSAALHVAAGNGLSAGDIVAVSDCDNADVFQITGPNDPGTSGTLNHNTGSSESPGNATQSFGKTYGADATVAKLAAVIYYVAPGAGGRPALYRAVIPDSGDRSASEARELVEGIESLQVLYGKDTTGDGAPDVFLPAGAVGMQSNANWDSVVSVRIALLVSQVEEYGQDLDTASYTLLDVTVPAANDRRMRRVFSTTVNLRNRSG